MSTLQLRGPFKISSRLLPCLDIGGAHVQLDYSERPGIQGRDRYRWTIDLPDGSEHTQDDLQSGAGGGSILEGFRNLVGFLSACAESYPDGENADLFPAPVAQWASANSDEIAMLQCELDETDDGELIVE